MNPIVWVILYLLRYEKKIRSELYTPEAHLQI